LIKQYTQEEKQAHLHEMWDETMKNHLCGNYIGIDDNTTVEWFVNYEQESFVAFTEYGSYTHHYDWDFSWDSNLETFVEDVIQFILSNRVDEVEE
jgi:hypothetical protein